MSNLARALTPGEGAASKGTGPLWVVESRRFGRLELPLDRILFFPQGLYAFEHLRHFALLDIRDAGSPLKWLQSFDDGDIAFLVAPPAQLISGYKPEIPRQEIAPLGLNDPKEAVLLAILTVPGNPREMTANLQAPLVLNPETRVGRQVVLPGDRYSLRHPVFQKAEG